MAKPDRTIAVCPQITLIDADDVATTNTQRHQDNKKNSHLVDWDGLYGRVL